MTDLSRFRLLLEVEQEQTLAVLVSLRGDVGWVSEARRDSNVDDEHDPEGATIAFELAQATAVLLGTQRRMTEITGALKRFDDGEYGLCAVCGAPISEGRLEARPWTAYCIAHATNAAQA